MLSEEPQCLTHDLARHSAVVKEIKGVWAFGMVYEGNREIVDQSLTDKAIEEAFIAGNWSRPALVMSSGTSRRRSATVRPTPGFAKPDCLAASATSVAPSRSRNPQPNTAQAGVRLASCMMVVSAVGTFPDTRA